MSKNIFGISQEATPAEVAEVVASIDDIKSHFDQHGKELCSDLIGVCHYKNVGSDLMHAEVGMVITFTMQDGKQSLRNLATALGKLAESMKDAADKRDRDLTAVRNN